MYPIFKQSTISAYLFAIVLLATSALNLHAKVLIWDLGDTLINPGGRWHGLNVAYQLGFWGSKDAAVFSALTKFYNGKDIKSETQKGIYDILDTYEDKSPSSWSNKSERYMSLNPKGCRANPLLMRQWFLGEKTSDQIRPIAVELAEKYQNYKYWWQKPMFVNTLRWMFTPEQYAEGIAVIDDAVKLLEDCVAVKNKSTGKPEHEFYILSNFDSQTFNIIYNDERFKPVFKNFKPENMVVSAFVHDIKPRPSMFEKVMKLAKAKPQDCVLIDDQADNCNVARDLGMSAVQIDRKNVAAARKQLKKLGILA